MENIIIIGIVLIIGIIFKYRDRKKKIIREPREVLCSPSGVIIKIRPGKWNWLCRRNEIKWSSYNRHYVINDKYSKFKV